MVNKKQHLSSNWELPEISDWDEDEETGTAYISISYPQCSPNFAMCNPKLSYLCRPRFWGYCYPRVFFICLPIPCYPM